MTRSAVLSVFVLSLAIAACGPSAPEGDAPGATFKDCDACPEMVVVPAGRFMMGSAAGEELRYDVEGARHPVTIPSAFAVGKFEVTRAEYATFAAETNRSNDGGGFYFTGTEWKSDPQRSWKNPGFDQTDTDPVVCVSWDDAKAYVAWLASKTGMPYRLLSEAEWEYVARAGTPTPFSFGSTITTEQANFDGDFPYGDAPRELDRQKTTPVASFAANAFGLYDMHGNAWEWVEDCEHGSYDGATVDGSPWLGALCNQRVLRGGSWMDPAAKLRSAMRSNNTPAIRVNLFGFRVAKSVAPSGEEKSPETPVATAPKPDEPGSIFKECDECPEMVVVPAGSFVMGSPPDEKGRYDDEGPQHQVTIAKPFAVSRYELTAEEWDACRNAKACEGFKFGASFASMEAVRQPARGISLSDAQAYVAWLSAKTGATYRLLSEAEWEYATRGGTTTAYSFGGTLTTDDANFNEGGNIRSLWNPVRVGSFPSNAFGLYEMHGNVAELVEDCWNETYDGAPTDGSAWLTGDCNFRIKRGGSYDNTLANSLRAASRGRVDLTDQFQNWQSVGLRVARTLD